MNSDNFFCNSLKTYVISQCISNLVFNSAVNLQSIETAPCAYFVICTGGSPQQVDAITDSVEEFARKQAGEKPAAICGRQNAEWVALDYGTVMVHVFLEEAREHYDLENLWDDAELQQFPDVD